MPVKMPQIEDDLDDSLDNFMIFPITDIDNSHDGDDESCDDQMMVERVKRQGHRPSMTLRQRRYSKLGFGTGPLLKLKTEHVNNNVDKQCIIQITECMSPGRRNWLKALNLIRTMSDPWEKFKIEKLPAETALRHRYNALKKQWKVDEVTVKMETEVSFTCYTVFSIMWPSWSPQHPCWAINKFQYHILRV